MLIIVPYSAISFWDCTTLDGARLGKVRLKEKDTKTFSISILKSTKYGRWSRNYNCLENNTHFISENCSSHQLKKTLHHSIMHCAETLMKTFFYLPHSSIPGLTALQNFSMKSNLLWGMKLIIHPWSRPKLIIIPLFWLSFFLLRFQQRFRNEDIKNTKVVFLCWQYC